MDFVSEETTGSRVALALSILERRLQSGAESGTSTLAPTTYPPFSDAIINDDAKNDVIVDDDGGIDQENVKSIGIAFLVAFAVVAIFVAYRSFKVWQIRRERHLIQVQNAHADTVLGDMQVSRSDSAHAFFLFLTCRMKFIDGSRWSRMTMSTKMTILNYSNFCSLLEVFQITY